MGTQEREIFVAFSLVASFLAALLAFFFFSLFKQNRKYRRLQIDKLNAEINATELERNLIATELHNDIGPYLSSIKMRLNLLETENNDDLLEVKAALDKCVDQVRGMAKSLAPLAIFHISLIDALKQYISNVSLDQSLKIQLIEKGIPVLTQDQSNQLYRILQEIILNTVKHAHATELNIEFSLEGNFLLIRIADNGIGYDAYEIREKHKMGLGLLGIQSRIEYLNGTMVISDEIKKGTRYNIRIPIVEQL
ncbi:MAG: sensor histidine kinase [Sediminibacterium sp.]